MAVHGDEVAEVARWAEGIDRVHECIAGRFRRPRTTSTIAGLSERAAQSGGAQERVALAEQAGDATPYGVQHLLSTYIWDADLVRDDLRTTWWSTWATPTGCWWWMKPGFSRRGTSPWGCSVSTAARRDGSRTARLGYLDLRYCQGEDPAGPGALPAPGVGR